MTSDPTTTHEKSLILFRHGFLREQDRFDAARVEARWRIYKTIPQKTFRSSKPKPADAAQ